MHSSLPEKLQTYKSLLLKWSKVINLVSPTTLQDCDSRHFFDSLQLLPLIPTGVKTIFDIGSGAGFPGLVLAIERPDIKVHLIESDTKKCVFLQTVSRETLTPVIIHNSRIEAVDNNDSIAPDLISARALASLVDLLGMTERWWKNNPQLFLLFPKGEKADDEISKARNAYSFQVELFPSQTEKNAKILRLSGIERL